MSTEEKILNAAARLLEEHGAEAVTTRSVCQAAGVTAPTLYHHFGDKNGLVRALVDRGIAEFMVMKRAQRHSSDALTDLGQGWRDWTDFGLERPSLFRLMIEAARADPSVTRESFELMRGYLERLHDEGRLQVEPQVAADAMWAAASGVQALFMQGMAPAQIRSTADFLYQAVVAAVLKPV
ncbi:TetR/AcrR family transcriptional regulator [Lysobacter enzymogenes]|uniref:TetR/AcrR family transcriptional regulator n=1 Tax=Lysobacter enzymogenes TaxID=69 RepID=UPI000899227E|nr:TetR/AcrR family transcriptional regulator [Lysobacter enzymogenes]SDW86123.1 DNA-binding transcriptional regulator, AcrR family [Lysobacter enzymogenes]